MCALKLTRTASLCLGLFTSCAAGNQWDTAVETSIAAWSPEVMRLVQEAADFRTKHQVAEAADASRKALALQPHDWLLHYKLAGIASSRRIPNREWLDVAHKHFLVALEAAPLGAQSEVLEGLSAVQVNQHDLSGGAETLRRAVKLSPNSVFARSRLGEVLIWSGQEEEGRLVLESGMADGLFADPMRRSQEISSSLPSKPFYKVGQYPCVKQFVKMLQRKWKKIRDEFRQWRTEKPQDAKEMGLSQGLHDSRRGNWSVFDVHPRPNILLERRTPGPPCPVEHMPILCDLLFYASEKQHLVLFDSVRISSMLGDVHVWPHCGETNRKLTIHLTLEASVHTTTRILVNNKSRSFQEGRILVFDDSFEHEVFHNDSGVPRDTLWIQFRHPELVPCQLDPQRDRNKLDL